MPALAFQRSWRNSGCRGCVSQTFAEYNPPREEFFLKILLSERASWFEKMTEGVERDGSFSIAKKPLESKILQKKLLHWWWIVRK